MFLRELGAGKRASAPTTGSQSTLIRHFRAETLEAQVQQIFHLFKSIRRKAYVGATPTPAHPRRRRSPDADATLTPAQPRRRRYTDAGASSDLALYMAPRC